MLNLSEWDAKYRNALEHPAAAEPAAIVTELLPLLPRFNQGLQVQTLKPGGEALDLACGAGRHALLLATHGYHVTAVDASAAALDVIEKRARSAGIPCERTTGFRPGKRAAVVLTLVQLDLESTTLPQDSFDLILCVHYLQRPLFPQMERALRPGGTLVFETYVKSGFASTNPETVGNGPHNPEFLLEPHELRSAFPSLRMLFYRELRAGKGLASLLAQRVSGRRYMLRNAY
jgi:SAM-dependent methyltransferase